VSAPGADDVPGHGGRPRTYRPWGALVVAVVGALSLLATIVVIAVALPPQARASFTVVQHATLGLVLLGALSVLFGIARTRVRADTAGLHVVNGYRRHDLDWAEAVRVSLGRGAPWAVVDTSAGETLQLMAIQRSDGDRAVAAVRELRAVIAAHTPPGPLDEEGRGGDSTGG